MTMIHITDFQLCVCALLCNSHNEHINEHLHNHNHNGNLAVFFPYLHLTRARDKYCTIEQSYMYYNRVKEKVYIQDFIFL